MFPNTTIRSINSSCPIVTSIVTNRWRNGTLQHKCRQRRNLRWKIVIGSSLATNCRNGKNQISKMILLVDTTAFTKKQTCLRADSTQQIHNNGGIRTPHTKINHCNSFGTGRNHISIPTQYWNIKLIGENLYVLVEVSQQYILSKILQVTFCVTWQPISYDFFFCFHNFIKFAVPNKGTRYLTYKNNKCYR